MKAKDVWYDSAGKRQIWKIIHYHFHLPSGKINVSGKAAKDNG